MAWPTLVLRIAFASAPMATSPSWDAVTSSLRSIHIKRGRQHELDQISAGTAQLELDNRAGNYWPNNAGGDYSPNVLPGKRIQLYAVYGGVTYYLYTGFIEDWNPEWLVANAGLFPIVRPVCSDLCNNLANFDLNDGAGYAEELSGTRVGNVLDDLGWPAADRDLDPGKSYMQATGALADENAWSHLLKIQQSELGILYIAGDGHVQFEDRHHRLISPHMTSQATFGEDAGEKAYHGMEPRYGADSIRNDIRVTRSGGTQQSAYDSTSQTNYGKRSLSKTGLLLINDYESSDQANYLLGCYKDPALRARTLRILPEANPSVLWPQVLGREISDRITVRRNEASLDEDYFIESIEHNIDLVNYTWETKWQLSNAYAVQYWVLGVAGYSEMGETTRLAY